MSKWGKAYAHKAAVFASTPWWIREAKRALSYAPHVEGEAGGPVLLDLGCNLGALSKMALEGGIPNVHAMDVNEYAVEQLKAEGIRGITTHTTLDTVPGQLDFVIMMHVINQIEDLEDTMSKVWERMRPGGFLVVVTHNPIPGKFRGLFNKIKGYKSDATMVREPRLGELRQLMYEHGFKEYDSYYFGDSPIPFLNRRLFYVGTKP